MKPTDPSFSKATFYARLCASLAMLMAFLVLVGWHFKIDSLKTFVPGLVTMNPMTATAFLLTGTAIWLLSTRDERLARWADFIGIALVGVGVLKLGDLLGLWHCLPDTWIYGERVNQQFFNGRPNRLAPNTAFNFVMQGGAILLRNVWVKRGALPSQVFLALEGFTSLLAVLGYFYGARSLNDFGSYSPMALPTGLGYMLLTLATLLVMADRGVMKLLINQGEAGSATQKLLISGMCAPLLLGWLTLYGQRSGHYKPVISIAIFCMAATVCFVALTLSHGARLIELQNERAKQDSRIRESEERFKFLADSAFEGISISVDGVVIDANNQFCRMFGYKLDEIIGMPAVDFVAPESRDTVALHVRNDLQDVYQVFGLTKKGDTFDLEISARTIPLNGRPARVTALRDITQRRQMERMKDDFVSTVSHELRTPLTSIHGALGLLANGVAGNLSGPGQAMVDVAVRNTRRLLVLINDLLDIQKIEAGEMQFNLLDIELNALIENSVLGMKSYGEAMEVTFEFEPQPNPVLLQSDPDRLGQVITNLLSNAAKFSPSHGVVHVKLDLTETGDDPDHPQKGARVEVTDAGSGIPAEFRDRIFQKFAQADSSTTRQVSGTGLGLSICKTVIDRLGGTIGFESEMGEGTTFYFELPISEKKPVESEAVLA